MNENEARQKWCPFTRIDSVAKSGAFNRYLNDSARYHLPPSSHCIASECMAWRWASEPRAKCTYGVADDGSEGIGYCGLAGKP